MKEKRSLLKMVFGDKTTPNKTSEHTRLQMLSGYTPEFNNFSGNAYESDVVRSAIDAISRNASKLKAKHIQVSDGEVKETKSQIEQLLTIRPNPHMNAYDFLYKIVTQLYLQNNSYIFVDMNSRTGRVNAFYPINSTSVELLEKDNEIFVKFKFYNGQNIVLPYEEVIHLRRFYNDNDLFGESNSKALNPLLRLIQTTDDGIVNAVKSSAFLRGLLKFAGMVSPTDQKKQRDLFVSDYMNMGNNGGIAVIDSKADYVELKNDPKMIDDKQMNTIKQKVYNYFGINEKIVQANYTEDEWNAFYESVIEPLAVQMSLEFTSKLFTPSERKAGHQIIFESNRLQYASMKTKLNLLQMVDRGAMTPNEWRAALNLSPIEGGDKPIRRLDTAVVVEGGEEKDERDEEKS